MQYSIVCNQHQATEYFTDTRSIKKAEPAAFFIPLPLFNSRYCIRPQGEPAVLLERLTALAVTAV
jgi:hypothetical protein